MRSRRTSRWKTDTQNSASSATTIGTSHPGRRPFAAGRMCGTVSKVTKGRAIRPPARCAIGPKRRSQMETNMPATKTAAPTHSTWRNSRPTPSATRPISGSTTAASSRPRKSRSSWLRDSDRHSTTASTAGPRPGAMASAHNMVASAASSVASASTSARNSAVIDGIPSRVLAKTGRRMGVRARAVRHPNRCYAGRRMPSGIAVLAACLPVSPAG